MVLLKDMIVRPNNNAEAFRLVYQILSQGSKTFQGVVREGINLRPPKGMVKEESSKTAGKTLQLLETGSKKAAASAAAVRAQLEAIRASQEDTKGITKKERLAILKAGVRRIPEDHPFRSGDHLKRVVLATLESQGLIAKRFIPITPATPMVPGESRFQWFLTQPPPKRWESKLSDDRRWDIKRHWKRLLEGEDPLKTFTSWKGTMNRRQEFASERAKDLGRVKRTEEEIWAWDGRDPDRTTPLQRLHLNKRNRKRKAKEERALVFERTANDAAKSAARIKAKGIEAKSRRPSKRSTRILPIR
ncbi:hypothetical protein BD324DRAFT_631397 [Kockovaella imperatae]|uniref:Uncharacterized protein n=1 Tax=Kockovaella imperatae TaxID=4999 RepID=A0A1Y1UDY2_9TREE|nr:hypothetical protein BD324DRAFT_631397 [Kockovaella imperatae]ORX35724.1 hypothetical protein BD324DRAFT_631397 [Kockovaella imperatae]